MRFSTFFLLIFCLFFSCKSQTDKKLLTQENLPIISKKENCPFTLYNGQGNLSRKGDIFFKGNNINQVKLIFETSIYKDNPLKVDEVHLTNKINRIYPDKNASGICALDWEGKALAILEKADTNSKEFKEVFAEYMKALKIGQRLRPNVKWGHYGLPGQNYWHRNEEWRKRAADLLPLFKEADIIFPSIYDFYDDSVASREKDAAYVNDNVVLALKMGARVNKPVLPFVWHRYHNSNPKKGYQLIPEDEFKSHLNAALNAKFKNKQIDGLVWWGADRYFYNVENKVLRREAAISENFDSYQTEVLVKYSTLIYDLFNEHCN